MGTAYTIFLQIIKMFIMICIGYYLYKKDLTNNAIVAGLSNLLLYVATPATIVNSFLQEYSSEKIPNLIFAFVASFVIYTICTILSEIVYRGDKGVDKFGVTFSNAGFIGIPLVSGVFGSAAVFYLAPFIGMFYVFVWTYGIWIMCHDKKEISLKKVLINPCILALFIGVAIFLLRIQLPSPLSGTISSFAGLTTPLAMIVLGAHVAKGNIKDIITNIEPYKVCLLRLIVAPLIIVALFSFIPERFNEVKQVLLIAEAAPIGAISPILAQMYHKDATYGAQTVCLSTLLCVLTIPLIMMVAELIW